MQSRPLFFAVLIAATLPGARAGAHVAAAVDENNRYIKIVPMGDRVQVAYTVFVGEVPGTEVRGLLDKDGDGTVSPAEAKPLADKLAADAAADLSIAIDGQSGAVGWDDVSVNLAASELHNNALSITMVAWRCFDAAPTHELVMRDAFMYPPPGETEVDVESGPGISFSRSTMQGKHEVLRKFKWVGLPNPMTEGTYELTFTVNDATAVVLDDARCQKPPPPDSQESSSLEIAIGGAVVGAAVLFAIVLWVRRRADGGAA